MSGAGRDLTVALCTRNRAGILRRTLENLRSVRIPAGLSWELIVADNASEDGTAAVLDRCTNLDLPLRILAEPRIGKSHAANRILEAARGRILVWTDDDVRPAPDWIECTLAAVDRRTDGAFFGGPVRPWFEQPPPPWLAEGLRSVPLPFALLERGPDERPLRRDEKVNGPNMAVRTEIARRYRYDPTYGPGERRRFAGSETWVQECLQRDGHVGYWVPDAVVEHWIPETSMTQDYIAYRYRLHGKTIMKMRRSLPSAGRSLLSLLFESYPAYLAGRALRLPPHRWLRSYRRAQTHLGKLFGVFA